MARFNASQADNYGGQGGSGFFRLVNDRDKARVRFMYNTVDDIEGVSVHQVEVNGKKRYVNCLREYNEPIDKCPFCADHKPVLAKLFIPVYDVADDKIKIWERGKKAFGKLSSLCSHYADPNLVEVEFEVERIGKAGDQQTTYEIWPAKNSKRIPMEELPEIPDDFYNFVLDKSADDMEYYLSEGEFPPADDDERPRRRNDSRRRDDEDDDEVPFEEDRRDSRRTSRRTPASSRRRSAEDDY